MEENNSGRKKTFQLEIINDLCKLNSSNRKSLLNKLNFKNPTIQSKILTI
jgi:hypothetical protein